MIIAGAEPFFLPGGRRGVLLIHGFTGLPAEMRLLGEYLHRRGYTVLGVRLSGHATNIQDLVRQRAEDWLDSARDGYALLSGACAQVAVIGHSMGGLLALALAAEKKVAQVVTLAAPIYIAEERGIEALPPREQCAGLTVPKARRRLKNVPPAVNCTYRQMPLISVHELLDVIGKVKPRLPEVLAPILIMQSRADHTAAPRSADYIYEHVGSRVKEMFWLEKAGHLLPLEPERELVFARAAAFLEENS